MSPVHLIMTIQCDLSIWFVPVQQCWRYQLFSKLEQDGTWAFVIIDQHDLIGKHGVIYSHSDVCRFHCGTTEETVTEFEMHQLHVNTAAAVWEWWECVWAGGRSRCYTLPVFPPSCAAPYFCWMAWGKSSLMKSSGVLLVPNKAGSTLNQRTRLIMVYNRPAPNKGRRPNFKGHRKLFVRRKLRRQYDITSVRWQHFKSFFCMNCTYSMTRDPMQTWHRGLTCTPETTNSHSEWNMDQLQEILSANTTLQRRPSGCKSPPTSIWMLDEQHQVTADNKQDLKCVVQQQAAALQAKSLDLAWPRTDHINGKEVRVCKKQELTWKL